MDIFHVNWLQNALPMAQHGVPAVVSVLGTDFGLIDKLLPTYRLNFVLKKRRSAVTPNAHWMVPKLREVLDENVRVEAVPFGVDESWYRTTRKRENAVRKWLVVSRLTRRKIGRIFDWAHHVTKLGDEIHLFGPMQERLAIPESIAYHGPADPDTLRVKWFSAATGLITLSQHDEGRPQIIIESLAAGVPVVATDLPAHKDLILHKRTGFLVKNEGEFIDGITYVRDDRNNLRMGQEAHNWTKSNIGTWKDCAERYVRMYSALIDERNYRG